MSTPHTGVILLNMGGPAALEDVPAYLLNIFRDPHILDMPLGGLIRPWLSRVIARKRAAASASRYEQIGGKSPLAEIAVEQARIMEDALSERGLRATVRPGMRYWHPFTEEAVRQIAESRADRIVAVSMYPAYCRATTGSSLEDFRAAIRKHAPGIAALEVEAWPDLPAYVEFLAQRACAALESIEERERPRTAVLFSAHSVPAKLVEQGDPYKNQIEKTFRLICARLPQGCRTALGWQSAVGPAKWLSPDTKYVAGALRHEGARNLIVVPLGFVAENIETLWDIEIDLRECARALGFSQFLRVECPNADARVMGALADLVANRLEEAGHEC